MNPEPQNHNANGLQTPPQGEPQALNTARLNSLLLRFLNNLKRTGRSHHTLSAYRTDLVLFGEFLIQTGYHPGDFTGKLKDDWVYFLHNKGRHAEASVRRALMSARTFLRFLIQEKIIESSSLLESKSPKQPTHDLLTVLPNHFRTLMRNMRKQALMGDEKAIRDFAIIQLLGKCGLKATEAANATWGDVSFSGNKKTGGSLVVRGHGERIIPLDTDTAQSLQQLRNVRTAHNLPTDTKAKLFFGYLNLSRRTKTESLHRHGIKFVVYEVTNEVIGTAYNSESLRNYAIASWIEKGLNAQQVSNLAGYSSLNSLERFSLDIRKLRLPKRQLLKTTQD
jgi:site-specific recombinase XerD